MAAIISLSLSHLSRILEMRFLEQDQSTHTSVAFGTGLTRRRVILDESGSEYRTPKGFVGVSHDS